MLANPQPKMSDVKGRRRTCDAGQKCCGDQRPPPRFDPGFARRHKKPVSIRSAGGLRVIHRLTLSCIVVAALAIIFLIPLKSALAGPDEGADQQEEQHSDRDTGTEQKANEPQPQSPPEANGAAEKKAPSTTAGKDCGALETAAAKYGLPRGFVRRLIRQESNFDPKAISRAGAMGIAQFMPGTARWRGLADPFEPNQALMNLHGGSANCERCSGTSDWRPRPTMPGRNA